MVGSSRSTAAHASSRQHHFEREALALAAGEVARIGLLATREAGGRHPGLAGVLDRMLVDQVVARVLQQQSHLAGALDPAPSRRNQALGQPQQRALARPVAAHQRDPLACGQVERDPTQHHGAVLDLVPDVAQAQGRRGAPTGAPQQAGEPAPPDGRFGTDLVRRATHAAALEGRASLLDRHRQGIQSGQREQLRGRRGQGWYGGGGPGEELAGRRIAGHAPLHHRDDAVGGGQAALEPMLGDHHGRAPVLVEPAQQPDELIARHGVQLRGGLVEEEQARPVHHGGGDRHPLQLTAREGVRAALEQVRHPEGQGGLLHRSRDGAGRLAPLLQGQLELGPDTAHHHLGLGLLEDRSAHPGELAGPVLAHIEPADPQLSRNFAAVEVRDEAAERPQQRRLARAGGTGEHREGARLELEADVTQRRPGGLGIAVAEGVGHGQRRAHRLAPGPMPRRAPRPAKGLSARSTMAALSTHTSGPQAISSTG